MLRLSRPRPRVRGPGPRTRGRLTPVAWTAMKVAALYDVHGNLAALEAVMADARLAGVDVIVSGGDLVMGPFPAECLDRLEADGRVRFLRGNGDREVCELDADGELAEAAR